MLTLSPGSPRDLVLEIRDGPLGDPVVPSRAWAATQNNWARAVPGLGSTLAPEDARHTWSVLRGLTSSTGGMVGAATTSLPERAEEGRNYDYRYVWIRDQCYAGQALAACGGHELLDDAVRFVCARLHEDGPRLAPAYTMTGGPVPDQRTLGLPGYPGGYDRVTDASAIAFESRRMRPVSHGMTGFSPFLADALLLLVHAADRCAVPLRQRAPSVHAPPGCLAVRGSCRAAAAVPLRAGPGP